MWEPRPSGHGRGHFYVRIEVERGRSLYPLFTILFLAALLCLQYIFVTIFGAALFPWKGFLRIPFRKPRRTHLPFQKTSQKPPAKSTIPRTKPPAKSTNFREKATREVH